MNESQKIHREAMEIIDEAMYHPNPEIRNDEDALKEAHKKAYELEFKAAQLIPLDSKNEPSRSILYRSAGWIAFHAGMYDEAISCANEGLKGCIHEDVKEELNDILKSV
jgi:hypothetical protein